MIIDWEGYCLSFCRNVFWYWKRNIEGFYPNIKKELNHLLFNKAQTIKIIVFAVLLVADLGSNFVNSKLKRDIYQKNSGEEITGCLSKKLLVESIHNKTFGVSQIINFYTKLPWRISCPMVQGQIDLVIRKTAVLGYIFKPGLYSIRFQFKGFYVEVQASV